MPTQILHFTNDRLQPALFPGEAILSNGKFGASKTFPAGCVIGRKTSDGLLYPAPTTNVVQTVTANAAATAGTWTLTLLKYDGTYATTSALAYNASIATIQTALDTASGVTNGVVASSAASAAPMSTPTALILTFSGTSYTALEQPLVTVNFSNLTGPTAVPVAYTQPDVVQRITLVSVASAGSFNIQIMKSNGVVAETGPLAFDSTLAALQTALNTATGITSGIVAASTSSAAPISAAGSLTLTYSGSGGYTGAAHPLANIELIGTGPIGTTVDDITITEDGSEVPLGFSVFSFSTDANSKCYLKTGTAAADTVVTASDTMPFYIAGTFKKSDLPGWRDYMLDMMKGRAIGPSSSGLIRIP